MREERGTEPSGGAGRGVEELRKRAITLGFAVVALGILALLIAIYWQLGNSILWAGTLAVLFYPLHVRIVRLLRGHETPGAVVSTAAALTIVFIPSIFIVLHLVAEVKDLWPIVRDGLGPEAFERTARWLEASRFRSAAHLILNGDPSGGAEALQSKFEEVSIALQEFLLHQLRAVTRNVPGALVQFGVTIVAFFFFLLNGISWSNGLQKVLPLEPAHAARLFGIVGQTINVVFRGVVLTAGAQAVAAGLGYWVSGAPVPILLSIATFLTAMIPVVGAAAMWLPVSLGLLMAGRTGAGIGLMIYGTLFVSLLDNFLRPILIGRSMRLPILWLFLAIVGGLKLFGFLGVIAGPMVLSLAMAIYRIYQEGWPERRDGEAEAESGRAAPRSGI